MSSFGKFYSAVLEKKSKMWKVNGRRMDNRRTEDRQRVITILHLSLRLMCTEDTENNLQILK